MSASKPFRNVQHRCLGRIAIRVFLFVLTLTCITKGLQLAFHSPDILRTWNFPASTYWGKIYPTAKTRDIRPVPVHSHNDYWRRIPFYSALAAGAVSVEADVWEYSGELYVGHDTASLTRNRTLKNLYIGPILEVLGSMNQEVEIPGFKKPGDRELRGVFDMDRKQTLNLYIDLKTPGASTLPVIIDQLKPLRTPRNYLTHWNSTDLVRGVVTVHLTGNAPFDLMLKQKYRDYFYDAPLKGLRSGKYNTSNSLMATADFKKDVGRVFWGSGGMTKEMKETVMVHVREAHERGIGVRYWGTPNWPISVRNDVWGQLVKLGVDLLGVDDLKGATEREW